MRPGGASIGRRAAGLAKDLAKDLAKRQLRRVFEGGQRLGLHILPVHQYAEVPDIRRLRRERAWRAPRAMTGVRGADVEAQLSELTRYLTPEIRAHLAANDVHADARRRHGADGFGPIEAEVLFAFVAARRPGRVVQVGCGVSTAVVLAAAEFTGYRPSVVAIDPAPSRFLREAAAGGVIDLVPRGAESVDVATLTELDQGDLLFVDSTHASLPGGEVNRVVLDVLPRLRPGVYAHFHDINFPYDYSRDVLAGDLGFPHESVLLHALLIDSARYAIAMSLSMLHYARRDALRELLPRYRPATDDEGLAASPGHFPSSLYLIADGRVERSEPAQVADPPRTVAQVARHAQPARPNTTGAAP